MEIVISVVIPTYNRRHSLSRCLEALENQSLSRDKFEVIIVNDGSSDDTKEFLSGYNSSSGLNLVIFNNENQGPAVSRNMAIKAAKGEFIAFTDDDCVPQERWLKDLLEEFPKNPKCAGVGGKILRLHDTVLSRYIDEITPLDHQTEENEINFLVTANAMYRRSVLLEVDGFDTRFLWAGGEDPELSMRITNLGYYLKITGNALVKHDHRATLKSIYKTNYNYGKGMKMIEDMHGENHNIKVRIYRYSVSRIFNAFSMLLVRKGLSWKSRSLYFLADLCVLGGYHFGYLNCKGVKK